MSVRLRDIADHLGISVSTVSLALRAAPQIAEETRIRVRDAAAQLGYVHRPRLSVRTELAQVAFITQAAPDNVFYAAVLSGAERECRRHKIALHYTRIDDSPELALAQYSQSDGLLVVGSVNEQVIDRLRELERPMVLIDNNLPFLGLDRVLIENASSLYRTVAYLARLGHRRIAHLSGPLWHPSFRERRQGYYAAIADLGLEPIEIPWQSLDVQEIARALVEELQASGQLRFSALITCNDLAAITALHTLQESGVHIPNEISVVGFDDIDVAAVVRPALTTNHVDRELLGELGVRRLVERANDSDAPALALVLETLFVERSSARPPRAPA
jgi:LacI family transcriptional regulator, repressor for deo operon, udp, cdd, tsx, nupC, and nupG